MSQAAHTPHYQLLAVFRSRTEAQRVEQELLDAGVDRSDLALGDPDDTTTSLRAEMRQELDQGWILPEASAVTKEGAKGLGLVTVCASLVGLVIAIPFAFIDFGLTLAGRLVLMAAVGLIFGAAVGLVVGPALASKRPEEPMAAQRGTVLRVRTDEPSVRALLEAAEPIRIDQVRGTVPTGTIATDEDRTSRGVVEDIERGLDGNDYSP